AIAADQGLAALQVEFPVVPVAGEDAGLGKDALAQRVALVGTAVRNGDDVIPHPEQQDLAASMAHHGLARLLEPGQGCGLDPTACAFAVHARSSYSYRRRPASGLWRSMGKMVMTHPSLKPVGVPRGWKPLGFPAGVWGLSAA